MLRDRVPEAVDILADIVQRPLFKEDEFLDAQAIMELEREEMAYEAQQLTMEVRRPQWLLNALFPATIFNIFNLTWLCFVLI